MRRAFSVTGMIILSIFMVTSCSKGGSGGGGGNGGGGGGGLDCSTVGNKAFAANVNPIIQATCNTASCHAPGSVNGPGPLTNYTEVFNARVSIRAAISSGLMPQGSTLTTAQKNSIICWIDSGAPNN